MTQLYKLTDEVLSAIQSIETMLDAGEIDGNCAASTIDGLQGELKQKAINVALHIKNLKSDIEQLKEAKSGFEARIKSAQQKVDWFESYLDTNLRKAKMLDINDPLAVIKFKKLPDIVEITGDVPDGYSRIIPESKEPDKVAIKEAIKSGVKLGFASLITDRTKLDIK